MLRCELAQPEHSLSHKILLVQRPQNIVVLGGMWIGVVLVVSTSVLWFKSPETHEVHSLRHVGANLMNAVIRVGQKLADFEQTNPLKRLQFHFVRLSNVFRSEQLRRDADPDWI